MHNLQTATTDLLRVITGSAADLDCIVSFIEATQASPPVPDWPETQFTNITTATTTTVLGAPASGSIRKIKAVSVTNTHASASTTVRVVIERTGPVTWDCFNTITLQPGESLTFTEGTGWFYNKASISVPAGATNKLTGGDQTLSTTDVYLNNSALTLAALGAPTIGRCYHWRIILVKSAGTAAPVLTVRVGTGGVVGDTARLTFTWGIGTSVADRCEIELEAMFIAVGASAILRGKANMTNNLSNTLTGFSGTTSIKALQPADSGTFDSTVASSLIGLSWNGSTAFAGFMEYLGAYTDQF